MRDWRRSEEVLVDPARDESLIFELLDLKGEVEDGGSALWFPRDVPNEQDVGDNLVVEHSGTIELAGLRSGEAPAVAGTAIGKLAVSKGRQGREAQNIVRLYLANMCLKNAATDVVITAYGPLLIKFIYCSSAGVYLKSDLLPHFETDTVDPKSRHKEKLETQSLLETSGVNWTSIRPVYIYGPLNYNPVEEWFFHRLKAGRPIPIPNAGNQITQLGHVKDLAKAFIKVLGYGIGDLTTADVERILDAKTMTAAPPMAPAYGLYLDNVKYDPIV
ncbi:hypothetical protein ZWY2020_019013 [Hordeum vulgare]|nr:hypothetical protein ZWY2020_019013 [Hordeum vulgare]